jgi:hypothetical protein
VRPPSVAAVQLEGRWLMKYGASHYYSLQELFLFLMNRLIIVQYISPSPNQSRSFLSLVRRLFYQWLSILAHQPLLPPVGRRSNRDVFIFSRPDPPSKIRRVAETDELREEPHIWFVDIV